MSKNNIKLGDAKCVELSLIAPVKLAEDNEEKNSFLIEAYTGEVVERWWGMLAIDINGIKAKKQIPVLMNHDTNQIVGFSNKTYKDKSFFVAGKFSDVTDAAKEAKGLAGEGFPWQASLGLRPVKIMSLEKDGKTEVNGKLLEGPAEVWLESEVFETSFVPLGADGSTSIATFSKFKEVDQDEEQQNNKKKEEQEIMEITMETLAKDSPELLAQIQADAEKAGHDKGFEVGVNSERERVAALLSVADADEVSKSKAITEGLSVDASYKLFFEAEKNKKAEELKALEESTPDTVGQQGKGSETDADETFMSAVDEYQKDNKCTRTEALQAIAKKRPALHEASLTRKEK